MIAYCCFSWIRTTYGPGVFWPLYLPGPPYRLSAGSERNSDSQNTFRLFSFLPAEFLHHWTAKHLVFCFCRVTTHNVGQRDCSRPSGGGWRRCRRSRAAPWHVGRRVRSHPDHEPEAADATGAQPIPHPRQPQWQTVGLLRRCFHRLGESSLEIRSGLMSRCIEDDVEKWVAALS